MEGGNGVNPKFKKIFEALDTDKSGRISAAELQRAMQGTGENVTMEACHLLISLYDEGTGSIDIHGLAGLFELSASWKNVFKTFDRDNSGFIEQAELKTALTNIFNNKQKFDDTFVNMLITKFGSDQTNFGGGRGGMMMGGKSKRDGLNDEQFLLACAFVQKGIPGGGSVKSQFGK